MTYEYSNLNCPRSFAIFSPSPPPLYEALVGYFMCEITVPCVGTYATNIAKLHECTCIRVCYAKCHLCEGAGKSGNGTETNVSRISIVLTKMVTLLVFLFDILHLFLDDVYWTVCTRVLLTRKLVFVKRARDQRVDSTLEQFWSMHTSFRFWKEKCLIRRCVRCLRTPLRDNPFVEGNHARTTPLGAYAR